MDSTAAVLHEPTDSHEFTESRPASIETIDVDAPGPEEVLVEIAAASLCHTDVSIALGQIEESHPLVMGHEGAGVVREVGDGVTAVAPGDHVVLGRITCGRCEWCRSGKGNLCVERSKATPAGTLRNDVTRFSGDGNEYHHCHGVSSFTEYTVVNEEVAIPITKDVPLEQATLLGCGVFTGFGAVTNTAQIEAGSSAVVFGAGGVGLSAVQGAAIAGAGDVIVVDLVPEKLEVAEALGATHTVDGSSEDPVERIRGITGGGADYAFDVVGNPRVIEQAIASVRKTGEVVLVGTPPSGETEVAFDIHGAILSEKQITGSFNGSYSLPLAIPMLAELVADGRLELEAMITGERPLDELNEAMEALETGTGIRQLIIP